jgi:putative flippase GtrA
VANGLPKFGVHYLVASAAGSVCSMLVSIMTNFFWIWRNKGQSIAVGIADTEAAGGRP